MAKPILKTDFKSFSNKLNRVVVRLSNDDKQALRDKWQKLDFPDPYNPNKRISFRSEQEYLEFVIRSLNKAGRTSWYLFSNILNPDYPVD